MRFIVGLGNQGREYDNTRHNVGFDVVDKLAWKHSLTWKEDKNVLGVCAKGAIGDEKVLLLKPSTYMNLSGNAVQKALNYYKGEINQLLVITDDVAIPLGALRYRTEGSPGGHNGLKDIEHKLGTRNYQRLRFGVGDRNRGDLSDHVLGKFSQKEGEVVEKAIDLSIDVIEEWLKTELGDHTWHVS